MSTYRDIMKIHKLCEKLAMDGNDVLFVADNPDEDAGNGIALCIGGLGTEPVFQLAARRLLRELEYHFEKAGLEFEYTIKKGAVNGRRK